MANQTQNNKGTKKQFNPTVTALFPTVTGNFSSRDMDEAEIGRVKEAINALKPGFLLFMKKGLKKTSNGKDVYFLEVVDPGTFKNNKSNGSDDDI